MALGANAEGEEERSLRDDLAASLKEIEQREASEATAAPEQQETPAPEAEAKVETAETKADRGDGRDAHGKFVSKTKEEADDQSPPATPAESQPTTSPDEKAQDQAPLTAEDQPPKSWRADEVVAWANVPPEAKAAILRREADAAKLAGQNDTERMFGREVAEVFRPHMDTINSFGVSPQFALKGLLENDRILRHGTPEQKLEKARQLVADYGLDISQLADTSHIPNDPHVAAMQQRINQLEGMIQRQAAPQQQQFAPLPPSAEESNIASEIEAFRTDPAHPHFDAVATRMGQLLETGAAPDLEAAYQAAVAMDPALRSTAIEPQRTQAEKTAAARQAAASVTGSPGPTGNPKPQSLRDELREQMRSAGFGV